MSKKITFQIKLSVFKKVIDAETKKNNEKITSTITILP